MLVVLTLPIRSCALVSCESFIHADMPQYETVLKAEMYKLNLSLNTSPRRAAKSGPQNSEGLAE